MWKSPSPKSNRNNLPLELAALGVLVLLISASRAAETASEVSFSAYQAQSRWMPGRTNLRWQDGRLESLFFVEVEAGKPMTNLTLRIIGEGADIVHSLEDLIPLSNEQTRKYRNQIEPWLTSSTPNILPSDLRTLEDASRKSVVEFWLPVRPGQIWHWSLLQGDRTLAETNTPVCIDGKLWWRLNVSASPMLNPLDYGFALLSKRKRLVQQNGTLDVKIPVVGLQPNTEEVRLWVTVTSKTDPPITVFQGGKKLTLPYLQRHLISDSISTEDWPVGRYRLRAMVSASGGASMETRDREVIVVQPKEIHRRFGAVYTDLRYDDVVLVDERDAAGNTQLAKGEYSWEDILPHFGPHQDVVVGFQNHPAKIVFWRGAGYVPMWVMNDVWFSWEWVETSGGRMPGYHGPVEPLMDREMRFGRVRVISSTPARAVIHWRYPQSTRVYSIVDEEWVDEYYTVYPDLTGVRTVMGWIRKGSWHEINEFITVLPPGLHPREAYEFPRRMVIRDLNGETLKLGGHQPWKDWIERWSRFSEGKRDFIFQVVNIKDRPSPYIGVMNLTRVYALRDGVSRALRKGKEAERQVGALEVPWNGVWSWPVQRVPAAGKKINDTEQFMKFPTHWCNADVEYEPLETKDLGSDRELKVWVHLLGLDARTDPVSLVRSWRHPAKIDLREGFESGEYDPSQRAYRFRAREVAARFVFIIKIPSDTPLVHPVFLIEDTEKKDAVRLLLDGQTLSPIDYRYGYERQPNGYDRLVVWLDQDLAADQHTIEIFLESGSKQ